MTRRTLVALAAIAVVTMSGAAYGDEPQEMCFGFRDNPAYCVGNEEGFAGIKLPPIGTGRLSEIVRTG